MFFLRQNTGAGTQIGSRSGVYICDECIELCNEIIEEELSEEMELDLIELPRPIEIKEFLINT